MIILDNKNWKIKTKNLNVVVYQWEKTKREREKNVETKIALKTKERHPLKHVNQLFIRFSIQSEREKG